MVEMYISRPAQDLYKGVSRRVRSGLGESFPRTPDYKSELINPFTGQRDDESYKAPENISRGHALMRGKFSPSANFKPSRFTPENGAFTSVPGTFKPTIGSVKFNDAPPPRQLKKVSLKRSDLVPRQVEDAIKNAAIQRKSQGQGVVPAEKRPFALRTTASQPGNVTPEVRPMQTLRPNPDLKPKPTRPMGKVSQAPVRANSPNREIAQPFYTEVMNGNTSTIVPMYGNLTPEQRQVAMKGLYEEQSRTPHDNAMELQASKNKADLAVTRMDSEARKYGADKTLEAAMDGRKSTLKQAKLKDYLGNEVNGVFDESVGQYTVDGIGFDRYKTVQQGVVGEDPNIIANALVGVNNEAEFTKMFSMVPVEQQQSVRERYFKLIQSLGN